MKTTIILMALFSIVFSSATVRSDEQPITTSSNMIYNFHSTADASEWLVVNDGVMGGVSESTFTLNDDGYGQFKGEVFTANNGGFASVRYRPESIDPTDKSVIQLRVKGDGKKYQFRVKKNISDYESYITTFQTSGKWETITIEMNDLFPSFRGRKLNLPNYDASALSEICFLIANKRNEKFELLIDQITIS